jgi:predicted NAD/FAD-dependent oxidoreductase
MRAHGTVACGDWRLGGRVEAAFLSGRALAGAFSVLMA